MMAKGWIANLLPALVIGLMIGAAASWQVENSLERRLDGAILSSGPERERLVDDIADATAAKLCVQLRDGCAKQQKSVTNMEKE
ncbi:hypothetical protein [Lelliottia nimipressuralis]|uniref:hypothetical protein n=1 Tax=Lelliottia nimipressuralis TaxID=69220 RepID=UPI0028A10513|nr:hypothetical protein [Lelliottia nimipressuralis]